jgi:hypothetical protein
MYRINQNYEIISLLLKIKELDQEYPEELFSARRESFRTMISRLIGSLIRM